MIFRDALFIAREDLKQLLRGKETLLWLFVMPIVFFYFIGTVTAGMAGDGDSGPPVLRLVGESGDLLLPRLVEHLEDAGYDVDVNGERPARVLLTLPEGFGTKVLAGAETTVTYRTGASELARQQDEVQVGRAVYTLLGEVSAVAVTGGEVSAETLSALDGLPRSLTLEVRPAGERQTIPTGFEQAIPGILVMFTLLVLLTSGGSTLAVERQQGLLRRLASAPISRSSLVLGKWLSRMALGLVQVGFAMTAGTLMFGARWGPDLPMVLAVLLAWAATCGSLGLLLGVVARTAGQAVGLGVLTANVLAALGGCWWPIEITPELMQRVQLFLPTGWTMDALHHLISFQSGAASAMPHLLGLLVAALVFGVLAVKRFRYE